MLLSKGDKILVARRRMFEKDEPRFFAGEVEAYEAGLVRVTGTSFARSAASGQVVEKDEPRTCILALSSGTLIVYCLPRHVDLDALRFENHEGTQLVTDGDRFCMNLTEHVRSGQF